LIIFITLYFSGIIYFSIFQKHISYDIYNLVGEEKGLIKFVIFNYYYELLIGVFIGCCFFVFFNWLLKKRNHTQIGKKSFIPCFVLYILFIGISIRGGIQMYPLFESHAFSNVKYEQGVLTLNPLFTIGNAIYNQKNEEIILLDRDFSNKNIKKILYQENEIMLMNNIFSKEELIYLITKNQ
jgi:hypothetical protein